MLKCLHAEAGWPLALTFEQRGLSVLSVCTSVSIGHPAIQSIQAQGSSRASTKLLTQGTALQ
jgi:hypothetical protein